MSPPLRNPCQVEAIRLREAGFWVIATYSAGFKIAKDRVAAGKEPMGAAWGLERWAVDRLAREFKRCPDAGIGVCLGPSRGPGGTNLVDVEVDGPDGWAALADLFGGTIPPTLGWSSTRGGHHLFALDDESYQRLCEAIARFGSEGKGIKVGAWHLPSAPGLEFRVGGLWPDGKHKQVQSVVPPTPGTDGTPRAWNGHQDALAWPESATDRLEEMGRKAAEEKAASKEPAPTPEPAKAKAKPAKERGRGPASKRDRVIAYLEKCSLDPAISGQRGSPKAFSVACNAGPGFDVEIEEFITLFTEHYNPKCVPPWSDKEIRHKVEDAYRKEEKRGWLLEKEPESGEPKGRNRRKRIAPLVVAEGANVTEEGYPIVPAGSNGYYIDKGGYLEYHDAKDGLQTLTNFTARITHDVVRHESATTQRQFRLKARSVTGRQDTADVAAVDFRPMKWVHDQLGSGYTIHEGRSFAGHTAVAVQLFSQVDGIHRMDVHTSTGWIQAEDGRWVYLHAGGMIGGEGLEGRHEADLPKSIAAYSLPEPPRDPERIRRGVRACLDLWNFADPARPSSGAMAAVLLCLPWRAVLGPSNFVIHFSGTTGTRKTTVARLALQHFSEAIRGRESVLTVTWKATLNSLQRYAHDLRDSLLGIDELTGYLQNETSKDFVQAQGNLKGRDRMTRDGKPAPSLDPRGAVLSTGEGDPTRQSAQGRMLTVEFFPGTVDLATLTRCQKDADDGLYAEAMSSYIAWLADGRLERARAEHTGWMEMATEHVSTRVSGLGVHPRQPSIAGHLVAGLMRFLQFARETGAIDHGESEFYRESVTEAFVDLMSELAIDQTEASDGHKFVRLIAAALNSGKCHLTDAKSNDCPFEFAVAAGWREELKYEGEEGQKYHWVRPNNSELIGRVDLKERFIYLDPDISKKVAAEAAKKAGCPIENLAKIGRELAKDDLCEKVVEGGKTRYDVQKKFHKAGNRRYFKLKIDCIFGPGSNDDPPEKVSTVSIEDGEVDTAF